MVRRRWWAPVTVIGILLGLFALALGWNPSVEQRDALQPRAAWAPPALSPTATLSQTFVPEHDGLHGLELLAVRYHPDAPLPENLALCLRLVAAAAPETVLVEQCQPAGQLDHNAPLTFAFPELRQVAGKLLRATWWAEPAAELTLWATAEESYADGALTVANKPTAGDLTLTLIHRYHVRDALAELGRMAQSWLWPLFCLALLLFAPGLLLASALTARHRLIYGLSLALAAWPLWLLWSSTVGIRYDRVTIWVVSALCAVGAALLLRRQAPLRPRILARLRRRETWLLTIITLLSLAMRLLNVRALVVPNWVDALHHAEITQLIINQRALPRDGGAFVSLPGFYYHFGFHALAAALAQLAHVPAYRAVLILGQALLAMAPLACYGLTRALGGQRGSAMLAALTVGCWSFLPGYYASWGRYTQMAGLLVLPGALLAIQKLVAQAHGGWRDRVLAALLVAGLLLTHYRISALLAPWVILMLARLLWRPRRAAWGAALWAAALALCFAAPWLWRLLGQFASQFGNQYGTLVAAPDGSDTWPTSLLTYRWTPYLMSGSAAGLLWAALRRRWSLVWFGVWAALCVLIPNLHWLGLPDFWLVNNTTVAISYWLPMGVLLGYLLGDVTWLLATWLRRRLPLTRRWLAPLGAALLLALALWGSWLHLDVVNASTVLVYAADLQAADWVRANLPPDALILVNSAHWTNTARRGTDGGWWLPLLAEARVTLPSLLYIQGDRDTYEQVNALALTVEQAPDYCDAEFLQGLHEAGVTHIYVGAQGGPLTPARLDSCPAFVSLYVQGPVRVYALSPELAAR